jgi:probable phosphoglycerate mutase
LDPIIGPNLHEVFLSDWEGGIYRIKAAKNDPIIIQMRREERWDFIPNAESGDVFHNRIQRELSNIACNHPDQLVVAVYMAE